MSDDGSTWTIQILFGRYREWGNLKWTHLIILGSVFFAMTYVYIILLRRRLNLHTKYKDTIPRRQPPIGRVDMTQNMFELMIDNIIRVEEIQEANITPPVMTKEGGDPGFGRDGSHFEGAHFNTTIAKSYEDLEKYALSRRPGLLHRKHRTIRQYMSSLRKAFPALQTEVCQEYINIYERAVFSCHKFSAAEFSRFNSLFVFLTDIITEKEKDKTFARDDNTATTATTTTTTTTNNSINNNNNNNNNNNPNNNNYNHIPNAKSHISI